MLKWTYVHAYYLSESVDALNFALPRQQTGQQATGKSANQKGANQKGGGRSGANQKGAASRAGGASAGADDAHMAAQREKLAQLAREKEMFEFLQEDLEKHTEHLHELIESELEQWRVLFGVF